MGLLGVVRYIRVTCSMPHSRIGRFRTLPKLSRDAVFELDLLLNREGMSFEIEVACSRGKAKFLIYRNLNSLYFGSCRLAKMEGKCVPLKANKKSV